MLHAWIANVLVVIVIVVGLGVPVRFAVVADLAVTVIAVVKADDMVPPEVGDDLLECFSLFLLDHAAVDAQRRQRRLVHLAPLNHAHDEVIHDARAGRRISEIQTIQQQGRQLWEDRYVQRCRRVVVVVVGRLYRCRLPKGAVERGPGGGRSSDTHGLGPR